MSGRPSVRRLAVAVPAARIVIALAGEPVAEQQAYLVQQEAKLRQGGVSDTSEISLLKSLSGAFGSNIKALSERPIEMHETRTGDDLPTLSPSLLMTEGAHDTHQS